MTFIDDEYYMSLALNEAVRADGRTSPNPIVGAVIVRDNKILGKGYHHECGKPHAEIEAINDAMSNGHSLTGATIYITLEPCCHYGKTPPCTDAIIKAGIVRVVFANTDPNPKMNGKSEKILLDAGIEVIAGVLEEEAWRVNEVFLVSMTTKRAFIALKYASSIDGKIATSNGHSHWISSKESLENVHQLRDKYDAILIGAGTLFKDNPSLTVRHIEGRNPVRIIVAGNRLLPCNSNVFQDNQVRTIVASNKRNPFDGKIPENIARRAFQNNLLSIMIEGGSKILTSVLNEKIADRLHISLSPIIIGDGISAFGNLKIDVIGNAIKLEVFETQLLGNDIVLTCKPKYK